MVCACSGTGLGSARPFRAEKNAWAGFGSAFGPVILLSLFWTGLTRNGALASMLSGALTVLIWIYGPFTICGELLSAIIYEIVPGFFVATATAIIVSIFDNAPSTDIKERHQQVLDSQKLI